MQTQPFNFRIQNRLKIAFIVVLVASLILTTVAYANHATGGADVKITNDNNNVDGGTPNPGFGSLKEGIRAGTSADPAAAGTTPSRLTTIIRLATRLKTLFGFHIIFSSFKLKAALERY